MRNTEPTTRRLPAVWTVGLRPEPGDPVPPICRLRSALKTLKRSHRLIAVDVREVKQAKGQNP